MVPIETFIKENHIKLSKKNYYKKIKGKQITLVDHDIKHKLQAFQLDS